MAGRRGTFGRKWMIGLLTATLILATLLAPLAQPAQVSAAPQSQSATTLQGVVRPSGADLYDVPGGAVTATLAPVDFVTIYGRDAGGEWLVVSTTDGLSGWVQTTQIIAYNIASLPVMAGEQPSTSASPTVAPTSAATTSAEPIQPATPTNTPTQPPTATPTDTPTPVPPTSTPTPTFTPTPLPPTATPTTAPTVAPTRSPSLPASTSLRPRASIVGVVSVRGVTLGSAPETADGATLPAGATVTLSGRNEAGDWLQVAQNDGTTAWLPTSEVVAFGVGDLPVVSTSVVSTSVEAEPTVTLTATDASITDASTTDAPTTDAPTTVASTTDTPTTDVLTTDVLTTDVLSTDVLTTDVPTHLASVLMTGSRLNIRSGPGTEFSIVGKAQPDEQFALLGRNEAGDWLLIGQLDVDGATGWVSATFIETAADLSTLPIVAPADAQVSGSVILPTATTAALPGTPAVETSSSVPSAPVETVAAPTAAPASVVRTSPTGLSGNIVFQDGDGGIWLYNLDAAELRRLATGYDPSFSPDGRTVTFVKGDGGNNGIYTIGVDGANERKIWGEGEILRSPKYSPDGEHIIHSRLIGEYKCFDTDFFGCISLKQLIAWFPAAAIPAVSRAILGDAPRLTFPNWGISRIGNAGGDFRDIAALDSSIAPDWNRDGIVYQSKAGLEITTDTPDGETRKVFNGNWDWDPDWQPNGGFILYQSKEGSHWEIWRVTPEGGSIAALTRPETTLVDQLPSNVAPAWSFDGQRIVYLSNRADDEEAGAWRLWTMNADGSDKRHLPIDVPINYGFAAEQVADWGRPTD